MNISLPLNPKGWFGEDKKDNFNTRFEVEECSED